MRHVLPILLIALPLLAACSDDDPPSGGFAVVVEVVDAGGEPVPGLELALWNDSPFLQDVGAAKAAVHLEWDQPAAARARVTIEDIEGSPVRVLSDEPRAVGWYLLSWDGRDDEGVHRFSGRYTVRLQGFDLDTDDLLGEASVDIWMAMGSFREDQAVGTTDARGRIVLDDMRLFPHLYERPAMLAVDETGTPMGSLVLDEDMVFILREPGVLGAMRLTGRVTGDGDRLTLVWRPVMPVAEARTATAVAPDKRDDVPPMPWAIRAYPNPFN